MIREETVFGPIRSRRLGNSLGINLLPRKGKLCNFDCIYCECGWNADGREDRTLPSGREVGEALKNALEECRDKGTAIDSITFSGDGEPTLHPEFPQIVREVIQLRDRYFPESKVTVLSNATQVHRKEVLEALRMVDNPVMKIDAATSQGAVLVNRPASGYSVGAVVEALKGFEGDFILQTMFLKAPFFDSSERANLDGWMNIVRELHPREIMVYTLDRPAPMEGLLKFSVAQMAEFVKPLLDEGFNIQIKG